MSQKTIYILFAAALLALIISFSISPPGTLSQPCLDEASIKNLEHRVDELKKVLHDCQSVGSGEKEVQLETLRNKVQACQAKIAQFRR